MANAPSAPIRLRTVTIGATSRLSSVVRLKELLATNKAPLTTYLTKGDVKQLWLYRSEA